MAATSSPPAAFRELLDEIEAVPPTAAVGVFGLALARRFAAREVSLLISDLDGRVLTRLLRAEPGRAGNPVIPPERIAIAGTLYEQALWHQRVEVTAEGAAYRLLAPVTSRGDTIGLLDLLVPSRPDEATVQDVASYAHAFAYVVIAERRCTDLYEWGQRTAPVSLATEIQRRLLPDSFTCEAGPFTLAGWLEPATDCGGDTFDYAFGPFHLDVSITDAVGHNLAASLLATLTVNSLRNSRRSGLGLDQMANVAGETLAGAEPPDRFVTGQLVRVELSTGVATIVNAGHPRPLLVREGAVKRLGLAADPPFGVAPGHPYRRQRFAFQPGDRLLLLTDGILEQTTTPRRLAEAVLESRSLHPREAVQSLTRAVVGAASGPLHDDATVFCLDWHGGDPGRRRETVAGASALRASR